MKILLKDVAVNNPAQNLKEEKTDILIENGIIVEIGKIKNSESGELKIFDFAGKIAVPGFFDMHVHLREPGREDKETVKSGCDSAANGGFTGVACMPNTEPAIDSAEVVSFIKKQASNHLVEV